jgi:hypothetical protein
MADKPFPWLCGECGRTEVFSKKTLYESTIKLPTGKLCNIILNDLPIPTCRVCSTQWIDTITDEIIHQEIRKLELAEQRGPKLNCGRGWEFCNAEDAEHYYDFKTEEWKQMHITGYHLNTCQAFRRRKHESEEKL